MARSPKTDTLLEMQGSDAKVFNPDSGSWEPLVQREAVDTRQETPILFEGISEEGLRQLAPLLKRLHAYDMMHGD
jgi:hypothetical protein